MPRIGDVFEGKESGTKYEVIGLSPRSRYSIGLRMQKPDGSPYSDSTFWWSESEVAMLLKEAEPREGEKGGV